jgi:hypothetical protein
MFGQKQALLLHLFTGINNALLSTCGAALCMTFWLGLTCYPDGSVHLFTGCCGRKASRNMWFQHDRAAAHFAHQVSRPLTTIVGLDGAGLWHGLPSHLTSH